MRQRIIIEVVPNIDLRKPPQVRVDTEGLPDPIGILAVMNDAARAIFEDLRRRREMAELAQVAQNGNALLGHA